MVGDNDDTCGFRDIIMDDKVQGLVRASYVHPKLMSLQYPILFPWGEDGFHPRIKFHRTAKNSSGSRGYLSMKDYYCYSFQVRENEGMTPRFRGRLFQQYMVDAYFSVEQTRLWWFRTHQTILRNELYSHICDSVWKGDADASNTGKGRGLPHIHMLIWLDKDSKKYLKENVDKFVSAELPDPDLDPVGYAAVKEFMIHGPCGLQNPKSPCMKDMRCIRHYPKRYCDSATFDSSGFPIYMRRMQHISVNVHNADLDNQWVVPYNRDLWVKYQCHMNVEICCHARSLKYLFKYCFKGHDRAIVQVNKKKRKKNGDLSDDVVDEINSFFYGCYLCGAESAWRIFGFPIHCRTISVERLPFHLPNQKNCTFRANESLAKVASREKYRLSKLEAFFLLNTVDHLAMNYTYDEIPQHYVWDDKGRQWNKRKRGRQIGRLCSAHHSSGEPLFLRLLLTKVKGPTSFEDIMIVNGMRFTTFKDACKEYGLLDDDREWHEVMSQCAVGGLPPQMRQLFVHIIVNCKVADILDLWNCHWKHMVEDILLKRRHKTNNAKLILNEKQLQFYVLAELNDLLRSVGKSLKNFDQLPQPPDIYLNHGSNNLIIEETCYDTLEMAEHHGRLLSSCNSDQLRVYVAVIEAVNSEAGGLFFVSGSGGSGKTYLWRTLIYRLRSEGRIMLPVATSGIAATLMPGGRTAHSRFKIPIVLDEFSLCNISHDSDIARLIKKTKLIIRDEAPM
ncbi:uncharacterized protein LOC141664440 [Apium graveolens]|uniref:uncharacterized protein LOC141664440 n=1 Tax=Apium graveolens TaxID=4045 RepID=UPI003D7A04A8